MQRLYVPTRYTGSPGPCKLSMSVAQKWCAVRANGVSYMLIAVLNALCVVGLLSLGGATALDSSRLSTAEAAAEYNRLSRNVTDTYFSNEDISLFVYGLADAYSGLVSVFSIGESALGSPLLAIDVGVSAGELCDPLKIVLHVISGVVGMDLLLLLREASTSSTGRG